MAKPVLITTAIIVHVPDEAVEDGFTYVEPFADQMRDAIASAFPDSIRVEYPASLDMEWLDDPETNIGKCSACGCWVSDYTRDDYLKGVTAGRVVDGRWLCDECQLFGGDSEAQATRD